MWNWRGATKDSFMGYSFSSNDHYIEDDEGRKIAKKIAKLNKGPAEKILKPYLVKKKEASSGRLNKFIELAEKEFSTKYEPACKALEQITRRPMMSDLFTFWITTFPRMPYFYEKREIFMFDSAEDFWGMPIDGFLHEGLHFQFHYYWEEDKNSPVSNLSDDEFDYIKEALTVVLDKDLEPLISVPDKGYTSQAEYRGLLHENWQKHHDFDELVVFGLEKLPIFCKRQS